MHSHSSQILFSLVSPLGVSLVLIFTGFLLVVLRHRRIAWSVVGVAFIWLWFWSMPITVNWFKAVVVSANVPQPVDSIPKVEAIVVLGGGVISTGMDEDIQQPFDLKESADRVLYAARLYRAGLAPYILVSGGNALHDIAESDEARAMASFLNDLGVPPDAILLETRSRNTAENARYSTVMLERRGIHKILLVTSATHMARAAILFESEGLDVSRAPTDYTKAQPLDKQCCFPDPHTLVTNSQLTKEIVGKYWAKLLSMKKLVN